MTNTNKGHERTLGKATKANKNLKTLRNIF